MFSVLPNQAILQDFLNLGSWQHQNNNSKMSQSDKAILWGQASFKNEMFCIPYATYFIVCYIWYLYFNTISVYMISNLILRISNPASGFMFCLLIIIMIVYLFWRDCNYNYSNCSRTLLILNLNLIFVFSVFHFFLFFGAFFFDFVLLFFCFFFGAFFLHFDLLFFFVAFFVLHFSHFCTNKLIFEFIGFWLTGCHKYIYIYLFQKRELQHESSNMLWVEQTRNAKMHQGIW